MPAGRSAPLVVVFHGGGGSPSGVDRLTRFSALADREGFLVAYPESLGFQWNDGRVTAASSAGPQIDDVGFVAAMIDAIGRERPLDPRRIYATGMSNGAIFSHYVGARLSARIAGIAAVAGGTADPFHRTFRPERPVSVLIIHGTKDPQIPYAGATSREACSGESCRPRRRCGCGERATARHRHPRAKSCPRRAPSVAGAAV
jgi:polyhydroxybutyrate depolymerase